MVPHRLLGEWLRLELATRLGVAAHLRTELPAEFAWSVMREAVPDLPVESAFEPSSLRWRIFDLLGRWTGDDPIEHYLADGDPRKRFELADKLALAYDRCLVFRNGEWNTGSPTDWHVRLWNELARDIPETTHWIDAVAAYARATELAGGVRASGARPQKAYLFGVAMFSPSYLEMLRHVGAVMDVHLFLLNPSRGFWTGDRPDTDAGGYYAEGNELVAAWGRLAREMQALLDDRLSAPASRESYGVNAGTCLGALQRDILERSTTGSHDAALNSTGALPGAPDDTIQIHVCHSATREVEVLHDRLLGLFDDHPDIQPADVLVLTPDLDAYAPVVEAVFGAADRITFNIGRQRARVGTAIGAFLDLLALAGSRYTAAQVLAPLRAESVRASFGLEEADLARIRDWVRRAGIRWGMDATHRTDPGVCAPTHNNWQHGLRRLLLAYAIPDDDAFIDGVVPCDLDRRGYQSGAGDYERLGSFVHYSELACELNDWMVDERTPSAWAERLHTEVLGRFFVRQPHLDPESAREIDSVARLIDDFARECALAGRDIPVPFEVLRDTLVRRAGIDARAVPRLADGVTVASLATGQIFPARVVCVIGMNDGAFPRSPPSGVFEFMDRLFGDEERQLGDRDVRDEDRFAFLEALLAARRCFVVSYTGRDMMEDKPIPSSVVVSELTDYLHQHFPAEDGWEIRHPLQPFNRRYFTSEEPNLFSYSGAMANAAAVVGTHRDPPARFTGRLRGTEQRATTPTQEIELDELIRFSASPAKYFLRNRLGVHLGEDADELGDDEPFELNNLESWNLKRELFDRQQAAFAHDHELLAATGQLPPGNLGRIAYRETAREVAGFATAIAPYKEHCDEVDVDIAVDDFRIVGRVKQFHADKKELLWRRIGNIRPKDQVEAWLLLLALTRAVEHRVTAHLLGLRGVVKPCIMEGPNPKEAQSYLLRWIKAWHDGQNRPLPFFPTTSWARIANPTKFEDAWLRDYGESHDAYHQLVFGIDPFNNEFHSLAQDLLKPLKEALQ